MTPFAAIHRLSCCLLLPLSLACVSATAENGPPMPDSGVRRSLSIPSGLSALPSRTAPPADWLLDASGHRAGVYRGARQNEIVLANGLLARTFRIAPNAATVSLDNLMTGRSEIRAVKPEALLTLNGQPYAVGGLLGQPEQGYLSPAWLDALRADPAAFHMTGCEIGRPRAPLTWRRTRRATPAPWPPKGAALVFHYAAPAGLAQSILVDVHYELYDGLPLIAKWLTVRNRSAAPIMLDAFTSEILAMVEAESAVDERPTGDWRLPAIHVQSDYSFKGMDYVTANRTTHWLPDPDYTSQVSYGLATPTLLVSRPPVGPAQVIPPGGDFETYRTYELLHDSDDRERQGLAVRRMLRVIAPWITENPLMMHVRSAESAAFRLAVDQCAAVGFEMIIYTFGSGLDMENVDPTYLAKIRADVDYAHAKGIQVGAYSLLASRRVDDENDAINPKTGRPGGTIFGNSPCLCSRWGEAYFARLRRFIEATGLDLLEHDGSYPGDVCASTSHPGHRGLEDSQWNQWRAITEFYRWCRARGVYLNVPDYYYLAGSNKCAMGYRESNWSLPRDRQIVLGRQNIHDGTWTKTPSMGWMFVPLVEYQGGGAAATLEPLKDHLDAYEAHLANNLGAGVQACYRGPRLYDSEETRALVARWVAWFKARRDILESDIIHVRRADGRDLDCLLHVNPALPTKGLAMVYNPLPTAARRTLTWPLYYTGLTAQARVRANNGRPRTYRLDREYRIRVPMAVPAHGVTWLEIE